MAKFVFKLENILQIKYKLEEQSKIEFGIAMDRLNKAIEKLELLQKRRNEFEDNLRQLAYSGAKVLELNEAADAVEIMKIKIMEQKRIVVIEEQKTDEARENLNKAVQERKIYEKLKENAFDRFKQEINMQEMKEVDELVSYTYSPTAKQVNV